MTAGTARDYEVAIIGGGLVGAAVGWGLARLGHRVAVLDEGDDVRRASRGNFALVWVQSKGLGMAEYAGWTVRSSNAWAGLADELRRETGVDVHFERPGGFHLALSDEELETRAQTLRRLHNQPHMVGYETNMLGAAEIRRMLPAVGPEVVGGSYCPLDGHVNSQGLLKALHTGLARHGARYQPGQRVNGIKHKDGAFRLSTAKGEVVAGKVVIAAGNATADLAPMVGLQVPMLPERGQIIVTERVAPFLRHPIVNVRQTDEGTVMIGDSREEVQDPSGIRIGINTLMAKRAMRYFPALAQLNVIRTWSAIRVMTKDGFPIYDQSRTMPGAFVVTCHSGVTLAANHALAIAPMIARGALDPELDVFSARRLDAQAHA
ncbi:MAG: FAD-dependent oxidoreductase [Hyphomicrobiaceae bacterium]|nr:FAD-dependent oxidoreductase [Hyphomicrobiaceae bacterium]